MCSSDLAPVVVPGPTTIHGLPYHGLQINSGISHLSNFAAGAAAQVPAAAVQVASVPAPKTSHGLVYTDLYISGTRRSSNRGRAERSISVVCLWTDIL